MHPIRFWGKCGEIHRTRDNSALVDIDILVFVCEHMSEVMRVLSKKKNIYIYVRFALVR